MFLGNKIFFFIFHTYYYSRGGPVQKCGNVHTFFFNLSLKREGFKKKIYCLETFFRQFWAKKFFSIQNEKNLENFHQILIVNKDLINGKASMPYSWHTCGGWYGSHPGEGAGGWHHAGGVQKKNKNKVEISIFESRPPSSPLKVEKFYVFFFWNWPFFEHFL